MNYMGIENEIGMVIGTIAIILSITATFFAFKASRVLAGGVFGKAFLKIAFGVFFLITSAAFMGIGMITYELQGILVSLFASGTSLLGSIFMLMGCLEVIKITKK